VGFLIITIVKLRDFSFWILRVHASLKVRRIAAPLPPLMNSIVLDEFRAGIVFGCKLHDLRRKRVPSILWTMENFRLRKIVRFREVPMTPERVLKALKS
jgi:hypothetical protein